jgi:hypothetical protein
VEGPYSQIDGNPICSPCLILFSLGIDLRYEVCYILPIIQNCALKRSEAELGGVYRPYRRGEAKVPLRLRHREAIGPLEIARCLLDGVVRAAEEKSRRPLLLGILAHGSLDASLRARFLLRSQAGRASPPSDGVRPDREHRARMG